MSDVVKKAFFDKEDSNRLNEVGQPFPREGLEVSKDRLEFLRREGYTERVVEEVTEETEFPIHKGGGNYLLSNGESVKGKEAALEAENALKSGE